MKKNITKLLPIAEAAIRKTLVANGKISKENKGYISSFGAAIVQSGLLPAIYFNHGSEGPAKGRKELMDAIFAVITNGQNVQEHNLLDYAKKHNDLKELKNQILDAATAIKLVIRTYELV